MANYNANINSNPDSNIIHIEVTEGGQRGPRGEQGATGLTAYEYAVMGGYTGTESEFLSGIVNLGNLNTLSQEMQNLYNSLAGTDVSSLQTQINNQQSTIDELIIAKDNSVKRLDMELAWRSAGTMIQTDSKIDYASAYENKFTGDIKIEGKIDYLTNSSSSVDSRKGWINIDDLDLHYKGYNPPLIGITVAERDVNFPNTYMLDAYYGTKVFPEVSLNKYLRILITIGEHEETDYKKIPLHFIILFKKFEGIPLDIHF